MNLYRYYRVRDGASEFVERVLCHDELYFSEPSNFNDPFDCRPTFNFDASTTEIGTYFHRLIKKFEPDLDSDQQQIEANKLLVDHQCNPNAIQKMQGYYAELVTKKIGVLCLSTENDDILMWAHYADSHRGICLEFDHNFDFFAHAQKVGYLHERPKINPFRQTEDEMLEAALLTKSSHWQYESEWRLIQYRNGAGAYHFPPESLTGVVFGAEISTVDKQKILRWIGERKFPTRIYQASPCETTFTIKIDEI